MTLDSPGSLTFLRRSELVVWLRGIADALLQENYLFTANGQLRSTLWYCEQDHKTWSTANEDGLPNPKWLDHLAKARAAGFCRWQGDHIPELTPKTVRRRASQLKRKGIILPANDFDPPCGAD